MWFLNILAIGFICNNIMSVESVREKPPRIIKQTSIPREKPSSPKKTILIPPNVIISDDRFDNNEEISDRWSSVGERIIVTSKPTNIFNDDSSDSGSGRKPITHTFTKIRLDESDSDESTIATKKTKHFKKHRTKTPISSDITETISDISQTVSETLGEVKKTVLVGILKQIIKSKQFTIILVLGTIFIGIGYIAKIIWSK